METKKHIKGLRLTIVVIVAVVVGLLMRVIENAFHLDIHLLLSGFIIGLAVVSVDSFVAARLSNKPKDSDKSQLKISPLDLIPSMIPGLGMIGVAGVSVQWILNLGAEWSVVRMGIFAWITSVALKFAFDAIFSKRFLKFLKSKLPTKLSGPFSWTYIGLLTGIFECGISLAFVLQFDILYQASWVDILAFGIGFGAFEAFALGLLVLAQISQYMLRPESIPVTEEEYKKKEDWKTICNYAILLPAPIVERVSTLCIHVFSSVLIILAVQQNNYLLFWLSFCFKTLVDGIAGWLLLMHDAENVTKASPVWAHQSIFMILALLSVAGTILLQRI